MVKILKNEPCFKKFVKSVNGKQLIYKINKNSLKNNQ